MVSAGNSAVRGSQATVTFDQGPTSGASQANPDPAQMVSEPPSSSVEETQVPLSEHNAVRSASLTGSATPHLAVYNAPVGPAYPPLSLCGSPEPLQHERPSSSSPSGTSQPKKITDRDLRSVYASPLGGALPDSDTDADDTPLSAVNLALVSDQVTIQYERPALAPRTARPLNGAASPVPLMAMGGLSSAASKLLVNNSFEHDGYSVLPKGITRLTFDPGGPSQPHGNSITHRTFLNAVVYPTLPLSQSG